ncbi:MAG: 6-phosphofructokinase [Anaerolineales bacterium]|nr:6-phosphofructokinase [Anaerolineales bacterium]
MSTDNQPISIGVLTSGGDSPGMNPAVRAVVRTALNMGARVFAIYEGYKGMVTGEGLIKPMTWSSVGGILQQGGTDIGSARCDEFRERNGRLQAARNLITHDIDRLVVIGGDGSLTGANIFRQEWPGLLAELVAQGQISRVQANAHPVLHLVGLVGSIDNDMFGTDMTIGADTALHRIIEAVDAINATAASHQRTFVIEVMGRHCGYLALMSAVAAGANWVLIPESPPEVDDWEQKMCDTLRAGRLIGRRNSIVIVAEGAQDRHGKAITSGYVKKVIEERIKEDTRVTILGHVQRGGSPSAFERYMSTMVAQAAVKEILAATVDSEPQLIGIQDHTITRAPLMACVAQTHQVADLIKAQDYEAAMALRGGSFAETYRTFRTLTRAHPREQHSEQRQLRLAIMHSGGPAPGMNTAVRVAVRLGLDKGHTVLAVHNGFRGLIEGNISEMAWMSVTNWMGRGGAELGTNRYCPKPQDLPKIATQLAAHKIDGLLLIGGWTAYHGAHWLFKERDTYPAFNIPIICLPATINNNLPGTEYSIGADTALNSIVEDVDKIKQSAVASQRCFVVEVMGHDCGYLALMSGIATGAERVYLPEEGVSLADLELDVTNLREGFKHGKRLGLLIRSERVDPFYTTPFMCAVLEREGGDLFDVRQAILGHVQQGGNPSPYDRIQATRLATRAMQLFDQPYGVEDAPALVVGLQRGQLAATNVADIPALTEPGVERPLNQWWLGLRPLARMMAQYQEQM